MDQILANAHQTLVEHIARLHFAAHLAKIWDFANQDQITKLTSATALTLLDGLDLIAINLNVHNLVKMEEDVLDLINVIAEELAMLESYAKMKSMNAWVLLDLALQYPTAQTLQETTLVLHAQEDTMELDMD